LITLGMLLQAAAIVLFVLAASMPISIIAAVLLGLGTALVYPNFLSVVAENSHPSQRAGTLSIFRFWRDSGYVIGALFSGLLADYFGLSISLYAVAGLTAVAGISANIRMCCTKKVFWHTRSCNPA
ncbi:MAG TPA: MFS transporter, partial [Ferruginibacter sp.]|nr:MFS transporter [Ferruginibacter sp.]